MIFICTCSQDGTSDLLLPYLSEQMLFRFNIDKPNDYAWDFSSRGFTITNIQTHALIDSISMTSFYLRKPIYIEAVDVPRYGCLENWSRAETNALFEDLFRECECRGLTTLVHSRNPTYGKLRQLIIAAEYFNVANWHIFHGVLPCELNRGRWVAKSLTGTPIGRGKSFFVKEVNPAVLDLSYPWFLQEKIDGEDEVTVVYANGKLFAYRYPRVSIRNSEDIRKATLEDPSLWEPCDLTASEQASIRGFMTATGYLFGRFDFIRKDGKLWFLELNPNGQWAWLDEDNRHGLISSIAELIVIEDRLHQQESKTEVDCTTRQQPACNLVGLESSFL